MLDVIFFDEYFIVLSLVSLENSGFFVSVYTKTLFFIYAQA